MGELERHLAEQRDREANLASQLQESHRISQERSREFIDLAKARGLGTTALYSVKYTVTPKRGENQGRSARWATNDVSEAYKYIGSGWLSIDESTNLIILPTNDVYTCALPLQGDAKPHNVRHDPYVMTTVHENLPLTPVIAPFWGDQGLDRLAGMLRNQ